MVIDLERMTGESEIVDEQSRIEMSYVVVLAPPIPLPRPLDERSKGRKLLERKGSFLVGVWKSGSSVDNTPSSANPTEILLNGEGVNTDIPGKEPSPTSRPRRNSKSGSVVVGNGKISGSSYGEWTKIGSDVSGAGRGGSEG
jgi:hypothetical protein